MCRTLVFRTAALLVAGVALLPAAARAQSAISGQVTDDTGGVLPGVTVEAASPALIEGSRLAVTDGQGRFSVVGLRPGIYTATFTLAGFGTVIREEIELPSGFTATIDATLAVGSLEESITVSGASPVVDIQQAQRTQVLTSETLESIVNTGSFFTQAMFTAGVRMTGVDVGGSRYSSDLQVESHGASSLHNQYMVDGLPIQNASGDGSDTSNYFAQVGNEETVIETSGSNAEYQKGGVRVNMIPRDGGNTFSGTGYVGGTLGAWQSDNFTQDIKDRGVTSIDRVDRIFDYSTTLGGPLIRDRIWFHFTARYWGTRLPVADQFYNDGSQYVRHGDILSVIPRLTFQATPRNKFTVMVERQGKTVGPKLEAEFPPIILEGQRGTDPETAGSWNKPSRPYGSAIAKWTSTVSNRVLLELGYSKAYILDGYPGPLGTFGAERFSPEWYSRVEKRDLSLGTVYNGRPWWWRWVWNNNVTGAISYVTGSHNLKTGVQWGNGSEERHTRAYGDINRIQYRNSIPDSVRVGNYPVFYDPRLRYDVGMYVQDAWTIDRLTVNYGTRVEWLNGFVAEQHAPAGRFVPERNFAEIKDTPDWGPDLVPRIGLAYDLFGDARTAVKFTMGKYLTPMMTSMARRFNPMEIVTRDLPWDDPNGDGIVQDSELDLTRLPTNFGERRLATLDQDIKREYHIETSASVQHELITGLSMTGGWYHRRFSNKYTTDDLERTPDDYRSVGVVSPFNGETFTVYDIRDVAELSNVDELYTNSADNREVYSGFEFSLEGRLPNGGVLLASTTTGRSLLDECDVDDPNELRFCDRFAIQTPYDGVDFKSDFKLAMSYPLPGGVQLSANYTSMPGRRITNIAEVDKELPMEWRISRSTRYTEAGCAGQSCTAGALVIPNMVLASLTVPLAPDGTLHKLERQNQLNFGVKKIFSVGDSEYHAEFNFYNALNNDTVLAVRSNLYGTSTYDQPSSIMLGRLMRMALRVKW